MLNDAFSGKIVLRQQKNYGTAPFLPAPNSNENKNKNIQIKKNPSELSIWAIFLSDLTIISVSSRAQIPQNKNVFQKNVLKPLKSTFSEDFKNFHRFCCFFFIPSKTRPVDQATIPYNLKN